MPIDKKPKWTSSAEQSEHKYSVDGVYVLDKDLNKKILKFERDHLERKLLKLQDDYESLEKKILQANSQIPSLKKAAEVYQYAGKILGNLLLEYGDHKTECDIWDLRSSGRLVEINEEEICSCDWSKTVKIVQDGKEKGLSGQFTKEEIMLLSK